MTDNMDIKAEGNASSIDKEPFPKALQQETRLSSMKNVHCFNWGNLVSRLLNRTKSVNHELKFISGQVMSRRNVGGWDKR